jgi:UDPglucose 6-dehydrogenase
VLGAAFKPGTDDVRESPTLTVVPALVTAGARVVVHDPIALEQARGVLGEDGIDYVADLSQALDGVDAVVLVTSWPEYSEVPKLLGTRDIPVIDGRRMLATDSVTSYDGVGYPAG